MNWFRSREARRPGNLLWTIRRAIYFCWIATLTFLIPFLILCGWYSWKSSQFNLKDVEAIPARTILLDRHLKELDTIHGANRRLLSEEDIPHFLKMALFAREDARFMEHSGVDFRGLARATIRNVKDMDFTQGASTLSMQLARNSFDLREKKSLNRKFLEIAITYRIEGQYSKDQILKHYLNRIYFGSGCHGLEEAALTYFGTTSRDLNRNQSALLVGIIRGPHAFSPLRNLPGALQQRDEVLARLLHTGELTQADVDLIKNVPLKLQESNKALTQTSHAARALRRPLEKALDRSQITVGGLKVTSSIDLKTQQSLEKIFPSLPLPDGIQVAALALEPATGDLLGIIGCRGERPTGFNRALDSRRGIGAAMIEPFINTCARERGHVPIAGKPVVSARQLGEKETLKLLKRFGFEGQFGTGEDLYRGTMTASLQEIAIGLATIINKGQRPTPRLIHQVHEGEHSLFHLDPQHYPAFSKHACSEQLPQIIIGTSPSRADLWGAAISKEKIIITWIGFDQPKKIPQLTSLQTDLRQALMLK